jgi:hypothetical protein
MEVSVGHADACVGRMLNAAWIKAKNMTHVLYAPLITRFVEQKHYLVTAENNKLHTDSNHASSWIFFISELA